MRAFLIVISIFLTVAARCADWYASTNGSGSGTIGSPFDLQTAFLATNSIVGGDTIWLRGGSYTHVPQGVTAGDPGYNFYYALQGVSSNSHISIRPYTNEVVLIDGLAYNAPNDPNTRPVLRVGITQQNSVGGYSWFYELNFLSSSTESRLSSIEDSTPADITRTDGPYVFADGVKFINCTSHDLTSGFSSWDSSADHEQYGCIVWNSGWQGPSQRHGHNFYSQTAAASIPGKTFRHNISVNPYNKGIQAYGSATASISHYRILDSLFMGANASGALFMGTKIGVSADRLIDDVITGNFGNGVNLEDYYHLDPIAYHDVLVANNYFKDGFLQTGAWKAATITNNTFINTAQFSRVVDLYTLPFGNYLPWVMDRNFYHIFSAGAQAWQDEGGPARSFTSWKTATGYDLNSSAFAGNPTTNLVVVQTNYYNANRANIIAYNWASSNTLSVPLPAWAPGDSYLIRNVQNYFGDVVSGTIQSGTNALIDMQAASHSVAVPFGAPAALSPVSFPTFGAFVIERTSASAPPPTPPPVKVNVVSVNPNSGVSVSFTPNDLGGLGAGVTSFSRTNLTNVVTILVAPGAAGGNNFSKWTLNGADFSTSATTAFTNLADSTLTAIFTNTTYVVSVEATNSGSAISVSVSPADNSGFSTGSTTFTRTYNDGQIVNLTAPSPAPNGNLWEKWQKDYADYSTNQIVVITNSAATTMTAVYASPIIVTNQAPGKITRRRPF